MLEKLDSIEWAKLVHAYGPALEVPSLVRGLTGKKAAERRNALASLGETINHQGTITPAAVAAAPFLVEVALAPDTKDRGRLLAYLANLAVGGDHTKYVATGYETRDEAFEKTPDDHPYKAIHLTIDDAAPDVVGLLYDKDAGSRAGAAMLLAFLSRHADLSASELRKRLVMEMDPQAKASGLLALGIVDKYLQTDADAPLFTIEMSEEPGLVQLAAAVALAVAAPTKAGPAVEQVLLAAVSAPPDAGKDFPWAEGALDNLAGLVLAGLVAGRGDAELAGRLLAATDGKPSQGMVAALLLDAVIPAPAEPARSLRPLREVSDLQRDFLKQLIERKLVPRVAGGLAARGLFDRANDLARFLGLRAQGPVDREVDGEPLWKVVLEIVSGARAESAWLAALAALSPDEVVAVCEDAAVPPYMLALPWPSPQDRPWSVERQHKATFEHLLAVALRDRVPTPLLLAAAERGLAKDPPAALAAALAFALSEQQAQAGKGLDPALDPLVAAGIDEGGHAADLRVVLERLPLERREPLVLSDNFMVSIKRLPSGDTVAHLRGAWLLLDLCPTAAAVEAAIEEIGTWKQVYPAFEEEAAEIFVRMGQVARARLEREAGGGETPLARIARRVLAAPAA